MLRVQPEVTMNKLQVYADVARKYGEDQFPHLYEMDVSDLCERRLQLLRTIKASEEEKKEIDEQLMSYLSEAELKIGVKTRNGNILKIRNRSSWDYPEEVLSAIKNLREEAQHTGTAKKMNSTYLTFATT